MICPNCESELETGFIYVRGIGAALHWSGSGKVGAFSRKNLEQIDLGRISMTPTGAQAVLPALRCNNCSTVVFESK